MAPDVGVTAGVCTLWQQEELVDYTIEVENEQFKVHKVILASVSDYFKAMLMGGMVESRTDRVRLEGLEPHAVSNMIEFIYTGQFGTKTARTEDLLGCAVYFQFPAAIKRCVQLLWQELNEENCFDVYTIFKAYGLKDSIQDIQSYIKANINKILRTCKPNELSYDEFLILMDFWGKSEWGLFDSANLWISVDFENRVTHLNDLMSHIRFALMTPEDLAAVQDSFTFTTFSGAWCDLVHKAVEYHTLPPHQKVLHTSDQNAVRGDPSPACFHNSSPGFYIATEKRAWRRQTALQTPDFHRGVEAVLEVNNYLIVCGTFHTSQEWAIFDPRTKQWSPMASMNTAREGFSLVHHQKHLYALGGRWWNPTSKVKCHPFDDRIERYSFTTNTWSTVSSRMPIGLNQHSACSVNGSIYVTGGSYRSSSSAYSKASSSLMAFNPTTDTWVSKAPLTVPEPCCTAQVVSLWDEDVILVVYEHFRMQYYSPSKDQWYEWRWRQCVETDDKMIWGDGSMLLAKKNHLFFLNFHRNSRMDGYDSWSDDYECTDPDNVESIEGACTKWSVEGIGKEMTDIRETKLGELPVDSNWGSSQRKFFCGLLSFVVPTAAKKG